MPEARAWSRPGAVSTLEITRANSPPRRPACCASMRARRFEPRPLIRTPTFFILSPSLLEDDALTRDHGADEVAGLAAALERVLDLVQMLGGDHDDHSHTHVEGP